MTNEAYEAKLWWRWVKDSIVPWTNLWKEKYAPRRTPEDLI